MSSQTSSEDRDQLENERTNLKNESFNLGFINYDKYSFCTSCAISYHKERYDSAIKESISKSLIITILAGLILIFGRYFFKSAKWVDENSKREI